MRVKGLLQPSALALITFAITLAMLYTRGFGQPQLDGPALDVRGFLLAAASTLPVVASRRAPAVVYAVTGVATLALLVLGYPLDVPFGAGAAAYTLAVTASGEHHRGRRRLALLAVLGLIPAVAVIFHARGYQLTALLTELAALQLFFVGLWIAGDRARLRSERIADLEAHAERAARDAERERRLAAAEERTRIARELHDSAGHAVNVILVQAGAARLLLDRDPEQARRAITTVEQVARSTIGEIDQLVRGLRSGDPAEPPTPVDPAALETLIAEHRDSGLHIDAEITGTAAPLPTGVAWATYRILQEALTNAARHGTGTARVTIARTAGAVDIAVANPGGSRMRDGGHGIVGMRERAMLLSGQFHAGYVDGVFRVTARLPLAGVAR